MYLRGLQTTTSLPNKPLPHHLPRFVERNMEAVLQVARTIVAMDGGIRKLGLVTLQIGGAVSVTIKVGVNGAAVAGTLATGNRGAQIEMNILNVITAELTIAMTRGTTIRTECRQICLCRNFPTMDASFIEKSLRIFAIKQTLSGSSNGA